MVLSFEDWQGAAGDVRNLDRMAELGYKIFLSFHGNQEEKPDEASTRETIRAFAQLLDLAFVHMRLKTRRTLRKYMLFRGRFVEPALWEDPRLSLHPHSLIELSLSRGERPTLAELLIIANDLEAYVRPNLLRLLWIAEISDGREKPYAEAMLKPSGEQGSIKHALDGLRWWIRSQPSRMLPKAEREALRELFASFKSAAPDQVNLDELRNWVAHRDFLLRKGDVMLHFHRPKGDRKALRIIIPPEQVTGMRRQLLGLISLLKSLEWMFRLREAAPARRRKPIRRRPPPRNI